MEQVGVRKKQGSIVEVIKDAILSGTIPADTEMTQNELAHDLGVSRMPVREALILLEYQGLVRRLPNNHVRVVEFSGAYFEKMFRMCIELECDVLENLAELDRIPSDELEFHRFIYREYPYAFQKKILETVTEIYISYAVSCSAYDREKGKNCIGEIKEAAGMGEHGKMKEIFHSYFESLKDIIMKERRDSKC